MIPKLTQLAPNLYVRPHTRSIPAEVMLNALQDLHVRQIVNVSNELDGHLQRAANLIGMGYEFLPIPDGQFIEVSRIRAIADYVANGIVSYPVLLHCNAGVNRTGLIAVLAVAKATGQHPGDVLAQMREVRPRLLSNPVFESFILNFSEVRDIDLLEVGPGEVPEDEDFVPPAPSLKEDGAYADAD